MINQVMNHHFSYEKSGHGIPPNHSNLGFPSSSKMLRSKGQGDAADAVATFASRRTCEVGVYALVTPCFNVVRWGYFGLGVVVY